jgi:hypothetical protein
MFLKPHDTVTHHVHGVSTGTKFPGSSEGEAVDGAVLSATRYPTSRVHRYRCYASNVERHICHSGSSLLLMMMLMQSRRCLRGVVVVIIIIITIMVISRSRSSTAITVDTVVHARSNTTSGSPMQQACFACQVNQLDTTM